MTTLTQQHLPRVRAAAIHFGLSLLIFAVALYLIVVEWYPGFHFRIDGGWQGVRIMALVDLVLGPALTLIVFDPRKPRRAIAFDLGCIAALQVAALAWGFYAIHGQRPVALNFYDGVFYSLPASSLRAAPEAAARLAELSDRPRPLIYVAMPATPEEQARARERAQRRLLAHEDAFFFRPLAPHWDEIQRQRVDPTSTQDPLIVRDLPLFLAKHGGTVGDYRFFRYQAGYGSCILAVTPAGEAVDTLGCLDA